MTRRLLLVVVLLVGILVPSVAQKISIESFRKVKKDPLNLTPLSKDKKQATLDLLTSETGFTFKADGKIEIQAEEGDGKLTLLAPHKTKFLLVEHPDYGQCTWKVPGKGLRKKKHYQANLITDKPGKEYKLSKQWVVFKVDPENAIVYVDSMMALVRDGIAQFNLSVGKHPYRIDAPFHEAVVDTLELTDSVKLILPVSLQSFYSYLTVETPMEYGQILLDGQFIGKGSGTSGHLHEGNHRLQVFNKLDCFYDSLVCMQKAEKKTIKLTSADLWRRPSLLEVAQGAIDTVQVAVADTTENEPVQKKLAAEVTITAPDDSTEIWVNREPMGLGKWEGKLELGYYTVNTRKDGLESKTLPFWVVSTTPKILDLSAPQASYGLLNIHSNVIGATVKINGMSVGVTPCVVENLPASKPCKVLLTKKGYMNKEVVLVPIGNDMLDVELLMIKR